MFDLAGGPLAAVALAILASAVIVTCLYLIAERRMRQIPTATDWADHTAFLLHDGLLVAATASARALLPRVRSAAATDMDQVVDTLSKAFPTLSDAISARAHDGLAELDGVDGRSRLRLEWWGETLSLSVTDSPADGRPIHPVELAALRDQAGLFDSLSRHHDLLIWTTDPSGAVTWSSPSIKAVADRIDGTGLARAADDATKPVTSSPIHLLRPEGRRLKLLPFGPEPERTFDILSVPHGIGTLHIAVDAGPAVRAEALAENYVQTFSRTFAELDVGLAIFDQHRRLVMFNPALTHLLRLSPDFLIRKPLIEQVLDNLRGANMLPEPKDYQKWRDRVADLEAEALNGTFSESWNMPDGRVYRVTGRPHPQGAIALLIEDISADVALSRRYRAEFETTQSLLDSLDDAIVVFSRAGTLRLGNLRYSQDWGAAVDSLGDVRLEDEIGKWRELCALSPAFDRLMQDLADLTGAKPLIVPLRLRDGREAELRAERLSTGDCSLRFRIDQNRGMSVAEHEAQAMDLADLTGVQASAMDG